KSTKEVITKKVVMCCGSTFGSFQFYTIGKHRIGSIECTSLLKS
ncbi:15464_t:CDS:2, partial [Funneliformis mosseae]